MKVFYKNKYLFGWGGVISIDQALIECSALLKTTISAADITLVTENAAEQTSLLRNDIYKVADIDSLLGKTANFSAAVAAIVLDVFGKLRVAKSMDDINQAVAPYDALLLRLQTGLANGELKAVHVEQGLSHEEAIIEGLEAYTKVAALFER